MEKELLTSASKWEDQLHQVQHGPRSLWSVTVGFSVGPEWRERTNCTSIINQARYGCYPTQTYKDGDIRAQSCCLDCLIWLSSLFCWLACWLAGWLQSLVFSTIHHSTCCGRCKWEVGKVPPTHELLILLGESHIHTNMIKNTGGLC